MTSNQTFLAVEKIDPESKTAFIFGSGRLDRKVPSPYTGELEPYSDSGTELSCVVLPSGDHAYILECFWFGPEPLFWRQNCGRVLATAESDIWDYRARVISHESVSAIRRGLAKEKMAAAQVTYFERVRRYELAREERFAVLMAMRERLKCDGE